MIDELIHLEKYNPLWKKHFICEQQRLKVTLKIDLVDIQHIGSTAISNIYAKPIIDIMIGVERFPPPQYITNKLINLGYDSFGEANVPDRLYFAYRQALLFNVHIVERDGLHWKSNLAFRDYLKACPEEAKSYEEVKMKAVKSGALSLLKYSAAKSAIIEQLISRSLVWQETNK